jgi:hypothetical protein
VPSCGTSPAGRGIQGFFGNGRTDYLSSIIMITDFGKNSHSLGIRSLAQGISISQFEDRMILLIINLSITYKEEPGRRLGHGKWRKSTNCSGT